VVGSFSDMTAGRAQSVDEFMAGMRTRLIADGNKLSTHQMVLGGQPFLRGEVLVAHRSAVRGLGKMDLFTAVLALPSTTPLTPDLLTEFKLKAKDYGLANVGQQAGFKLGLAVVPILVSEHVTPAVRAAALAQRPGKYGLGGGSRFNPGAFVWAAVADLAVSQSLYYTGWFIIGRIGSEFVREKMLLALGPELAKNGQQL
jgi:hypothetical protein